jgi:hypothetical protein
MKKSNSINDCNSFSRAAPKGGLINKHVKRSFAAMTILSLMTFGLMFGGCGGGSEGVSPQVVSGTAADGTGTAVYPAGVTATGGSKQVSLSWSAVPGAASYNIYYETTTGVTKTSGAKITNAKSPHVQAGLAAVTTYYFIVTAVKSTGEGAASAQASATTNAAPPAPACGSCHAIPPAIGRHSFHAFTSCGTCHGAGYSISTVNESTHLNGIKNVGGSSGWNETARSCSNSCHGTRSW